MQITKLVEQKVELSLDEIKSLMNQMIEARNVMAEAKEDLDVRKEAYKGLCESQNEIINNCFADYQRGYSLKIRSCFASYEGNKVTYTDSVTGEIVVGRVLEPNEQLEMTSKGRRDAEDLIRADND